MSGLILTAEQRLTPVGNAPPFGLYASCSWWVMALALLICWMCGLVTVRWIIPMVLLFVFLPWCVLLVSKLVWNHRGRRGWLRRTIRAERSRYGITRKSKKVFIVHSDADPSAALMFQEMVQACYERSLNVMHYTDFLWSHSKIEPTGEGMAWESQSKLVHMAANPKAMHRADSIVVFETSYETDGYRLECEELAAVRQPKFNVRATRNAESRLATQLRGTLYVSDFPSHRDLALALVEQLCSATDHEWRRSQV